MTLLKYSTIKKNVYDLYVESNKQGLSIEQYLGRSMYEYEQILDVEEKRITESLFFYLAVLENLSKVYTKSELNKIFPEGIRFIFEHWDDVLSTDLQDMGEYEANILKEDYFQIITPLSASSTDK